MTMQSEVVSFLRDLHDRLCTAVEATDGRAKFREDAWERPGGGGGRSRALEGGAVFEKAGINFSEVSGEFSPEFAKSMPGDGLSFLATGVSWVLHPLNPFVPTVHGNFRFITHGSKSWFGGGSDLTPYYPFREDVIHFHRTWKTVCDAFAPEVNYAKMKKDCDDYFYLPHRSEARGVESILAFVSTDCGALQRNALHADATRVSRVPPGALRRIQFDPRPGDAVRPEN